MSIITIGLPFLFMIAFLALVSVITYPGEPVELIITSTFESDSLIKSYGIEVPPRESANSSALSLVRFATIMLSAPAYDNALVTNLPASPAQPPHPIAWKGEFVSIFVRPFGRSSIFLYTLHATRQ